MFSFTARPATFRGRIESPRGLHTLMDIMALYRQRRALRDLDDHMLRDLGLTRDQAEAESRKPIWDAPAHWRA